MHRDRMTPNNGCEFFLKPTQEHPQWPMPNVLKLIFFFVYVSVENELS